MQERVVVLRSLAALIASIAVATSANAQGTFRQQQLSEIIRQQPAMDRSVELAVAAQPPANAAVANGALSSVSLENRTPVDDTLVNAALELRVVPTEQLRPGQLLFVPLDLEVEAQVLQALEEQIFATEGQAATDVQTFEGAWRQLSADGAEMQLKPYAIPGQPLQYKADSKTFIGTIRVGVADLSGGGVSRALTAPMSFEVLETALAAPSMFEIAQTSPPSKEVTITSTVVGTTRLRITSTFSPETLDVEVPMEPTLIVSIDADNLRAFGMQTARITVTAIGDSGPEGRRVTLSAPGAFLTEGTPPTLDESGTAYATLRTDAAGRIVVTASVPGYATGSASVHVVVPLFTIAAVTLGGLLGGFLRLGPRIRKRMNVTQFIVGMIISIGVGVLVFALYATGVKVLPVDFSVVVGDTLAFAIAGLAAWLGTKVLPKLPE